MAYDLGELGAQVGDVITLVVDRRQIHYVKPGILGDGRPVIVDLEPPALFCPHAVDVVDLATTAGLFDKSGAFYSYKGERTARSARKRARSSPSTPRSHRRSA